MFFTEGDRISRATHQTRSRRNKRPLLPPKSHFQPPSSTSPDAFRMALPPEQINIKRRREEEPVETLCMESPFFPPLFFTPRSRLLQHDFVYILELRCIEKSVYMTIHSLSLHHLTMAVYSKLRPSNIPRSPTEFLYPSPLHI